MPTVELTVEQVIELVSQLPEREKFAVFAHLRSEREAFWKKAHQEGEQRLRRLCAERGLDWDKMSEDERLSFVDDLLHED